MGSPPTVVEGRHSGAPKLEIGLSLKAPQLSGSTVRSMEGCVAHTFGDSGDLMPIFAPIVPPPDAGNSHSPLGRFD